MSYFQKLTQGGERGLDAQGSRTGKADHGRVTADEGLLRALSQAGLILDLECSSETVSFRYPDETVRFWLRDMGSALELHLFRACLAAGCFDDVVLSAVVSWNADDKKRDAVTNEIDVLRGQHLPRPHRHLRFPLQKPRRHAPPGRRAGHRSGGMGRFAFGPADRKAGKGNGRIKEKAMAGLLIRPVFAFCPGDK